METTPTQQLASPAVSDPVPDHRDPASTPPAAAPTATMNPPMDLTHHFSEATKRRVQNVFKKYYKLYLIPGIGNLSGGMPNRRFFPFETLEAQAALPDRWKPSPINPSVPDSPPSRPSSSFSPPPASPVLPTLHVTVPSLHDAPAAARIDVATALQYGLPQGYPPLSSFVRQFAREHLHVGVPYAGGPETLLTCGSTDGLAKTLELLFDGWVAGRDPVESRPHLLVEAFTYTNAVNQAATKGLGIAPVEMDSEGMLAEGKGGLKDVLENWDDSVGGRPRLLYAITMGNNPTGGVMSVARRRDIYAICSKYDVLIVEDDPYWYLQFPSAAGSEAASRHFPVPGDAGSNENPRPAAAGSSGYAFLDSLVPSFLTMDTDGRVIRLDTFSKTVAPGCRLGWITAQPAFIERLTRITETTTQQPSGFVQSTVAALVMGTQPASLVRRFLSLSLRQQTTFTGWSMDGWVRWLEGLRGEYERRMTRVCSTLEAGSFQLKHGVPLSKSLSDWGVVTKTRLLSFDWPRGGMFVWVRVHYETHPLWSAGTGGGSGRGKSGRHAVTAFDGAALSTAMTLFLTKEPHGVVVTQGDLFGPTEQIVAERAWAYFRLCFAAEDEDRLDASAVRLVKGIHQFWRIRDAHGIQRLLDEWNQPDLDATAAAEADGTRNLGAWMGC